MEATAKDINLRDYEANFKDRKFLYYVKLQF